MKFSVACMQHRRARLSPALASTGVSISALLLVIAATPASAQMEFCNTNACKIIQANEEAQAVSAFSTYLNSDEGRALLQTNAAVTTQIYTTSTPDTRALAAENVDGDITAHLWSMTDTPISGQMAAWGETGTLPNTIADDLWNTGTMLRSGWVKDFYAAQKVYATAYGAGYDVGNPRPFVALGAIGNHPWTTADTSAAAVHIQQADEWANNTTEASFVSGHSMRGFLTAFYYAMQLPTYAQDMVVAGQQYGLSRNIIGMHYGMDVIGGRIIVLQTLARAMANDPNYSANYTTAFEANREALMDALGTGAVSPVHAECGANLEACIRSGVVPSAAHYRAERNESTHYLTYGLPSVGDTTLAPVVPENAELLFRSRFPYLSDTQIRDVLATTSLPSGVPLDNGSGWARLNPYAANGGYGRLDSTVTVTLDASKGGLHAFDLWNNDISGSGGLIKKGTGTLLLAGDNSYTGGTRVDAGTLGLTGTLTGDLHIASGATFLSNGGYVVAPDAVLTSAGTLVSVNATLRNFGTVTNTGLLRSDVNNAGRLAGAGRIAGNLHNAGTLQPGMGTLTVTGNAALAGTSVYIVETGAAGIGSRIAVDGSATVDGTLTVMKAGGGVAELGSYEVLTAAGGVTGAFHTVTAPAPFVSASAKVLDRGVVVSVTPDAEALSTAGGSPNANAVGLAVAYLPYSHPVLQSVITLDNASAPRTLASLTGDIHATTASVLANQSATLRQAIFGRLRINDHGAGTPPEGKFTAWGEGYGNWTSTSRSAASASVSSSTAGFLAGYDGEASPGWQVGIVGGFNRTSFSLRNTSSSGDSDNYDLGLYGANRVGAIDLRYAGTYTWHDVSTSRTTFLPGLANSLSASRSGGTGQLFGEIGYKLNVGSAELEPFAGLAYVRLRLDGFTETGGVTALTAASRTQDNLKTTLGLRANHTFAAGEATFAVRGSLAWQHAFGTVTPQLAERFAFTNSPSFLVTGAPIARDTALVDISADWLIDANTRLGISYTGQLAAKSQSNAVQGRFSINF